MRLIDLMCDRHRDQVLDTRLWVEETADCLRCSTSTAEVALLPHLDAQLCIAAHEAGHAVAYLVLGQQVTGAEVTSDGRGTVSFITSSPQPAGVWAGPAALLHMLETGGSVTDADRIDVIATANVGANSDATQLTAMAADGVDIWAARDVADVLVAKHWPAVTRVAEALLDRGRLSGADVAQLADLDVGCPR